MIHYIKGMITEAALGKVVIENGNIGYEVNVPDNSISILANQNEIVTLYTAMIVREDDISLYGFTDTQSLAMFNTLMTVSGVGAKGALAILSALDVRSLKQAIMFEDVAAITKANGIGKKIAQRIVLELKDKVG
ncbi:MAG: Holliday junction branch migration protein RuvA, partial [Clostridia bacterium]|nr:Holliday junction branch migration protein RuvA [Clostridia bacterium]